jgi:hypothetical protein
MKINIKNGGLHKEKRAPTVSTSKHALALVAEQMSYALNRAREPEAEHCDADLLFTYGPALETWDSVVARNADVGFRNQRVPADHALLKLYTRSGRLWLL